MLYRFCLFDAQDRPAATEEIEVNSLLDAIARAHMILTQRSHHETVEVWLGNKVRLSRAPGSCRRLVLLSQKVARFSVSG
jgi:hypothetical protein